MTEYYFDIETTGIDTTKHKIITIQWQELDSYGVPIGELNIFKEWEESEKKILEDFLLMAHCENPFDFIFIGKNLMFDFNFINERSKMYGLKGTDLPYCHYHPFLDIKHVLVLINEGKFKGYNTILDKKSELEKTDVPKLYEKNKHDEIIEYIRREAYLFTKALTNLKREMPSLIKCFNNL